MVKKKWIPAWKSIVSIVLLCVFYMGIISLFVYMPLSNLSHQRDLRDNGVTTTGTVTGLQRESEWASGARRYSEYFASYTFTYRDQAGKAHTLTARNEVSRDEFKQLKTGSELDITYLADDPKSNLPSASLSSFASRDKYVIHFFINITILLTLLWLDKKYFGILKKIHANLRTRTRIQGFLSLLLFIIGLLLLDFLIGATVGNLLVSSLENLLY